MLHGIAITCFAAMILLVLRPENSGRNRLIPGLLMRWFLALLVEQEACWIPTLIARCMGPRWGPPGAERYILTFCDHPLLRNNYKCRYTFMYALRNSVCKGLIWIETAYGVPLYLWLRMGLSGSKRQVSSSTSMLHCLMYRCISITINNFDNYLV